MDQPLKKTKDSRKHSCFGLRDATLNPDKNICLGLSVLWLRIKNHINQTLLFLRCIAKQTEDCSYLFCAWVF